jgi:hydroxymethylbilane synthase
MILQTVTLGTRGSALARHQTDNVCAMLRAAWPSLDIRVQIMTTRGDQVVDTPLPLIGGKGLFTAELENALHNRQIDIAVHSLKDLPTENPAGLAIGATPPRANPQDALISRQGYTLKTLPRGAKVGTCSTRRTAQLLRQRPDVQPVDIRGNIDTRIRKTLDTDGIYDAIILACAGLERLNQMHVVSEILALEAMLPAPGQAALGVQCRDEADSLALVAPINHAETQLAVTAERAFLATLGGGCSLPVAAYASLEGTLLRLYGRVSAPDGTRHIDVQQSGEANLIAARQLGDNAAQTALAQGAAALLENT